MILKNRGSHQSEDDRESNAVQESAMCTVVIFVAVMPCTMFWHALEWKAACHALSLAASLCHWSLLHACLEGHPYYARHMPWGTKQKYFTARFREFRCPTTHRSDICSAGAGGWPMIVQRCSMPAKAYIWWWCLSPKQGISKSLHGAEKTPSSLTQKTKLGPSPSLLRPETALWRKGVVKLTRSSLNGLLITAPFAYKNGRSASSFLLLGIGLL